MTDRKDDHPTPTHQKSSMNLYQGVLLAGLIVTSYFIGRTHVQIQNLQKEIEMEEADSRQGIDLS